LRIIGRYGQDALQLLEASHPGELTSISDSQSLWAEIRWAARAEGVLHLDDLLLRRVRLGLTTTDGGLPWMNRIRRIAQPELGWDDARWEREVEIYQDLWGRSYRLPAQS
jgi:glycerol-3-phosphate dehydrogenase